MTTPRFCEQCGAGVSPSANFCPECGHALRGEMRARSAGPGNAHTPPNGRPQLVRALPWLLPSAALVAVIIFAVASGRPDTSAPTAMPVGFQGTASDISQLSADERVDRLFNRVMAAASAGKMDSVAFFAPMAVNSFAALEPLSPHRRYDLGLIHLVSGDSDRARAEADSILAVAPTHLLGLALAMRSATARGDEAGRQRFASRFLESLAAERARDLPEYSDHANDITEATAEAEGRSSGSAAWARSREGT